MGTEKHFTFESSSLSQIANIIPDHMANDQSVIKPDGDFAIALS